MRPITHIAIHHSAGSDSNTYDWAKIRAYHKNALGWRDIGYHFGVEIVDSVPVVHIGRLPREVGAHVAGHNSRSLGVCMIGNYSLAPPPRSLLHLAALLVADLCDVFRVPVESVLGHREFPGARTQCPGELFDMDAFRGLVEGGG